MTPPNKVGPNVLDRSANSLLAMVHVAKCEKKQVNIQKIKHKSDCRRCVPFFCACNLGAHVPFFLCIHHQEHDAFALTKLVLFLFLPCPLVSTGPFRFDREEIEAVESSNKACSTMESRSE